MSLAAALLIGGVAEVLISDRLPDPTVVFVLALIAGMALAWRSPPAGLAVQLAATVVQQPLGNPAYDVAIPLFAVAAAVGLLVARETHGRLALGLVLSAGTLLVTLVGADDLEGPGDALFAVGMLLGLPALVGRAFRTRSQLNAELRERAARLAADRQTRAEEAAASERRRIAGELHDLVAHGVSGMVVQAGAARRLVQTGDPRAGDAIRAVEDGGREALTELRRLLGVLRREDADLALAPQPSLSRVAALVARLREEGRDIELRVDGTPPALSPGLDVAGYRVIEEGLRTASGPAVVTVRYGAQAVELEVEGADPPAGALVGLRERVALFGGELAGARRGGPPALRARLPLREVA